MHTNEALTFHIENKHSEALSPEKWGGRLHELSFAILLYLGNISHERISKFA